MPELKNAGFEIPFEISDMQFKTKLKMLDLKLLEI
jgi:hypothetical protein